MKNESSEKRACRRFSQDFSGETKTQQHFKDSCDVNTIVAHYTQTGIDPYADRIGKGHFAYATATSFEEALRKTAEVNSAFAELPAQVRLDFAHSPGAWLDSLTVAPTIDDLNVDPKAPQEPSEPTVPAPKDPDPEPN